MVRNLFIFSFNMKEDKKKFIKKALLFLFLFLILLMGINEIYKDFIIKKRYLYRREEYYKKYLADQDNKVDYAFFGTSHTWMGINPEFIPNSVNYGGGGWNYIKIYHLLRRLIEQDKIKINNKNIVHNKPPAATIINFR